MQKQTNRKSAIKVGKCCLLVILLFIVLMAALEGFHVKKS